MTRWLCIGLLAAGCAATESGDGGGRPPDEPMPAADAAATPIVGCGDGVRADTEACDGADFGGATCSDFGFAAGDLSCRPDCSVSTRDCGSGACGNDLLEPGEDCDSSKLDGITCEAYGWGGGPVSCTAQCRLDTSNCLECLALGRPCGATNPIPCCPGSYCRIDDLFTQCVPLGE